MAMDDRTLRSLFEKAPEQELPQGVEPAEVDLSPEQEAKIRLARDLFITLNKTFKATRIYLANNELLQKFRDELRKKFKDYFSQYEDLELRIKSNTINMLGQAVYRSQDQTENLAQLLFRDGFRRLTFHQDLPDEELLGFLDILKRGTEPSVDQDNDMVTLFWERDFKYITYHAVEELLPEGVDMAEIDSQADAHIERIATLNFFPTEELDLPNAIFGLSEEDKRQDVYDNAAPSEETIYKSQLARTFLALDPGEIQNILVQVKDEKIEDLLIDMADTILEVIYIEKNFDDFKILIESLEQILTMFINFMDLERAGEILKRLYYLADGYRKSSGKAAAFIDEALMRASTEEKLESIFTAASQGTLTSISTLGYYLVHLKETAIPFLAKKLQESDSQDLRKVLCDVLVLIGPKNIELMHEKLEDKTETGIRNKIYILTKIGDAKSIHYFKKLIQNPNSTVRQLVISSLIRFYNPIVRDLLLQSLNDNDPGVRNGVVRLLAQTADPKVLDALLGLVKEPQFHEKPLGEKKNFFITIAQLGGHELIESFSGILQRKNLKDDEKDDEIRMCAAEALGIIATPEAIKILQSGRKIKRKAIVRACEEIIARYEERMNQP